MSFKPPHFVPQAFKYACHPPKKSIYSVFHVKGSHRLYKSPRVHREWRTKDLGTLTAFFRNRFYEMDRWYKARIVKPEIYPTCYVIDPEEQRFSLEERLKALDDTKNSDRCLIDIGLPYERPKHELHQESDEDGVSVSADNSDKEKLRKLAYLKQLHVDVKQIDRDRDINEGVLMRKRIAEHYNVFKDLFHKDAYFNPVVNLHICYPGNEGDTDTVSPVFYGNDVFPRETIESPTISYKAEKDTYWTLMLTNPDGNIYDENKEILHWMVCNIPEDRIKDGEVLCKYLQPLPLKNTGANRMVFVLFKQNEKIDNLFAELKTLNPDDFKARSFSTPEFYLKYQDSITPAGLAFFQTEWDTSCTKCFHEQLNTEQPIYDFDWPEPYLEPQEEFPAEHKPFNVYLDKYRDYKDIDKEILLKRLKRVSPFQRDPARPKFPNLLFKQDKETLATWLHLEKVKENEGYGKYRGVYENPID